MNRNKAIYASLAIILASVIFCGFAQTARAESTDAQQSADEQKKLAQMRETIDSLQKTVSELTAKVQARQAASQPKKMTLPEIASEVKRIAAEKEILAAKVQKYVAEHPRSTAVASTNNNAAAAAQIAEIKQEIASLTEKMMEKKTGESGLTDSAKKPQIIVTVPDTVKEATDQPAQNPSDQIVEEAPASGTETTRPAETTPEITISPEGEVTQNGEKQTIEISKQAPEAEKKGLFQTIADYIKSLFKF